MKRASGVLLPVFSLPTKYGIGGFSKSAYSFIDWLKEAKQSYWQILPLGPTSCGDSPYQPFSTFAGNPYFISLEELIEEGVLTEKECKACDFGDHPQYVDYGKMYEQRYPLLRKAFERSNIESDTDFQKFCAEEAYWLEDYSLFMAVKSCFGGKAWSEWAEDIRKRWGYSIDYYREKYADEMMFQKYMQYKFLTQWKKIKAYANENGIKIIGDLPIYVAFDSADAWSNPGLFQFNEENLPSAVAGCPPDAFSATGQLWGNPLYRWDAHRYQGYDWWIKRMNHCYKLYDVVRIDHFRGFDEYYSIPAKDETAVNGHWEKGPGMELFHAIEARLGKKEVVAEDLGFMTDSVRQLVKDSGYPNMKVLEFGFNPYEETGYLPHAFNTNCVVYTGTHDNDTLMAWYEEQEEDVKAFIREYLNDTTTKDSMMNWPIIRLAMMSSADTCIIPIQDYLGTGNETRINCPSTFGDNWKWRLAGNELTSALAEKIKALTEISFRTERKKKPEPKKEEKEAKEKKESEVEKKTVKETTKEIKKVNTK